LISERVGSDRCPKKISENVKTAPTVIIKVLSQSITMIR
jgi:hypothetical protein